MMLPFKLCKVVKRIYSYILLICFCPASFVCVYNQLHHRIYELMLQKDTFYYMAIVAKG